MDTDKERFWEIDALRGVAISMMVVYHFAFDLDLFDIYDLSLRSISWLIFARTVPAIFLCLVGISASLKYARMRKRGTSKRRILRSFAKRGAVIFLSGMLITFVTWVLVREMYIGFGILHMIGVSIVLAFPFLKYNYANLLLALPIVSLGLWLMRLEFSFSWLFWLGFVPRDLHTLDHFPLLPWFGAVLIGVFLGNTLYPNYSRRFSPGVGGSPGRFLQYLGRHSLLIYLVHQPILIALLYVLTAGDIALPGAA